MSEIIFVSCLLSLSVMNHSCQLHQKLPLSLSIPFFVLLLVSFDTGAFRSVSVIVVAGQRYDKKGPNHNIGKHLYQ